MSIINKRTRLNGQWDGGKPSLEPRATVEIMNNQIDRGKRDEGRWNSPPRPKAQKIPLSFRAEKNNAQLTHDL